MNENDAVAIVSPSTAVNRVPMTRLMRAERLLRSVGLRMVLAPRLGSRLDGKLSIKERIADLHWAFSDTSIRAVWCLNGGYSANQLLDAIDWAVIESNPKVFCGYSDITILNSAITQHTGLVTYQCPNALALGKADVSVYTTQYMRRVFRERGWVTAEPSDVWRDGSGPVRRNRGPVVIRSGVASGRACGGNLGTLFLLQGTRHFLTYYRETVLCVEEDDLCGKLTLLEFDRRLRSLLHQPGAEHISGLLIGRFQTKSRVTIAGIRKVFETIPLRPGVPVVANVDFGHTEPSMALPIGGDVRVVSAPGERPSIKLCL